MKRCTKCGAIKPLTDFHKRSRNHDGFNIYCRDCVSDKQRTYRKNMPEEIRKNQRMRRAAWHKEAMATDPEYRERRRAIEKNYEERTQRSKHRYAEGMKDPAFRLKRKERSLKEYHESAALCRAVSGVYRSPLGRSVDLGRAMKRIINKEMKDGHDPQHG